MRALPESFLNVDSKASAQPPELGKASVHPLRATPAKLTSVWKIAVIDDDDAVHAVTHMVLGGYRYKDASVEILDEYSAEGAKRLLQEHPDIAVMILDVVMESDNAGLAVVRYVREQLNNSMVRIILRTGQPGEAPEGDVIFNYDINDYREKTELSAQKLITAVTTALRAYDDLATIRELASSNLLLEGAVRERTAQLAATNGTLRREIDDRNRALEALRYNQTLLAEAQRIACMGNFEWTVATGEVRCSEEIYRIAGLPAYDKKRPVARLFEIIAPDDLERVRSVMMAAVAAASTYRIEHRIVRPNGEQRIVTHQGEVRGSGAGGDVTVLGIMQDITERHATEEHMRKLSTAVEQTADCVIIANRQGKVEYVNAAFTAMTGYTRDEIIGATPTLLSSGKHGSNFYRRLWDTILKGEVFSSVFINKRKDGSLFYEAKTITPQRDRSGTITHFISTGKDVTETMMQQERMQRLAHHDGLTDLPNRVLFMDRLEQAIARSKWSKRHVAVLFLDMDRFKVINDTLGHDTGDLLLKGVAQRLTCCVREGDTVARFGGDEFAIILNDVASREDVEHVARKIFAVMKEPLAIEGRELFMTTSIGVSMFPEDGDTAQLLLKRADVAMYNAKSASGNGCQFYTQRDEALELHKLNLESGLRRALEREEFFLVYQPQIDANSRQLVGIEALIRWRDPSGRIVQPLEFIPLLEETGMIVDVGDWVLQTACAEAKLLPTPTRVAVNISLHQFRRSGFVARVADVLKRTGLPPSLLELELTEGILIEDVQSAAATLQALHDLGVRLSIDDFGTGYASLFYLRRFPFDALKVDLSFVKELPASSQDVAIVKAILTLALSMGLETVAEGVEREDQLALLRELGCHAVQGHLFSTPLPIAEYKAFARRLDLADGASGR